MLTLVMLPMNVPVLYAQWLPRGGTIAVAIVDKALCFRLALLTLKIFVLYKLMRSML